MFQLFRRKDMFLLVQIYPLIILKSIQFSNLDIKKDLKLTQFYL